MSKLKNIDIRSKISELGINYWEIAEKLGITDSTFSRKLRKELADDEKTKILEIISKLKNR